MIAKEIESNINSVRREARRQGLGQMTVEHLTLVLLRENTAVREMLVDCHADVHGLLHKLQAFINANVPAARPYGEEPQPTIGFKRVLQRAFAGKRRGAGAGGLHVLTAVFSEPESYAAYCMQKHGIERLSLLARLAQQTDSATAAAAPAAGKKATAAAADPDLVAQAAAGKLERPLGRAQEISLLMRALSCKYKNNALLVGEPGVGKTALVHALACRLADGAAPPALAGARILPVSVSDLVAGAKYRGDFEQRVSEFAAKCRAHPGTVVFIDEIHTLIGAGAVSGSALDGANALKPLLEEKSVRYIGATTQAEYRRYFERDRALLRRFQKIDVREPDDDTLQQIMQTAVARLTEHHKAPYADDAASAAIALSRKYFPARQLPDKAIGLLDEAGAQRQLAPQDGAINAEQLEQLARAAAGLPPAARGEQTRRLANLQDALQESVFDQPEAAERLARAVLCGRLEYVTQNTVLGAFLFYGPTGVGKTEMARQLARHLQLPLLRYDMSECMERHAVSRLIGAPPGYVGFEQSGKLIEDIMANPSAIVLFDEVEKAHPDVLNILLQILDHGTLTDNSGRLADFRGALVILTSNLGGEQIERGSAGFSREPSDDDADGAVRGFFAPELRNRLDAQIRFSALSAATAARIANEMIAEALALAWQKKGARISVAPALRRRICQDGHSATLGARPIRRLVKQLVLEPLAVAEAQGMLASGGAYRLEEDGRLTLRARKRVPAPQPAALAV